MREGNENRGSIPVGQVNYRNNYFLLFTFCIYLKHHNLKHYMIYKHSDFKKWFPQ